MTTITNGDIENSFGILAARLEVFLCFCFVVIIQIYNNILGGGYSAGPLLESQREQFFTPRQP